jgi:hypothetical protein
MGITIQTSDGKTLDHFEKIQPVAQKLQSTPVMQNVANRENNSQVSYNSHSISVTDCKTLTAQIPKVLRDVHRCSYTRETCSGIDNVFWGKFAKYLHFLLAWLGSIKGKGSVAIAVAVNVPALRMKDLFTC